MIKLLLYSAIAGIVGTGLGGLIGILFNKNKESITSNVLAFAGGAMMGMVFFSIFKEALEMSNPFIVLLGGFLGVLLIYILSFLTEFKFKKQIHPLNIRTYALNYIKYKKEIDEENKYFLYQNNHPITANYKINNSLKNITMSNSKNFKKKNINMLKTGLIMFLAISLHNIPEGMAIGSVGTVEMKNGLTLSILLLIHNIPEGMAISLPLVNGGFKKFTSIIIATCAGAVTLLGGLIGIALGHINNIVSATTLAFAGGAMLNVTFLDIIPEVILSSKTKKPMIYMLIGLGFTYLIVHYV